MKKIAVLGLALLLSNSTFAQEKLKTRSGKVTFLSETVMEKIHAENTQTASILLLKEKTVVFNALMKSFKFEKALMEEHFNEKYVHSDKYPAAKFKGTFDEDIDLDTPAKYDNVTITGTMLFHGVTKPLKVNANITVNADRSVNFDSKFNLVLTDYNIEVPSLVADKISKEVVVSVATNYNANPTK